MRRHFKNKAEVGFEPPADALEGSSFSSMPKKNFADFNKQLMSIVEADFANLGE